MGHLLHVFQRNHGKADVQTIKPQKLQSIPRSGRNKGPGWRRDCLGEAGRTITMQSQREPMIYKLYNEARLLKSSI